MIAMRSSGDSNGPITPLPRGPSLNSWPTLLLPVSDVSNSVPPLNSPVSYPTLTGSNCLLPAQNVLGLSDWGDSSRSRLGTDPLCRNGATAQIPLSGRAL